jgi:hypothetical protein
MPVDKDQKEITKKIFNRIYYLLNKEKYIKKNKYRIGMTRYRNTPYDGKVTKHVGKFLVYFN